MGHDDLLAWTINDLVLAVLYVLDSEWILTVAGFTAGRRKGADAEGRIVNKDELRHGWSDPAATDVIWGVEYGRDCSYFPSCRSTAVSRGVHLRSCSLSSSEGTKPNFSSARSDVYRPARPQAMTPTPTPRRSFGERFLNVLGKGGGKVVGRQSAAGWG